MGLRKHHYKASGGDGISVELFQILKDNAVKVLHSICQQIWKTQQWPQDWKWSVFIPIPKNVQTGLEKEEEPEIKLPTSVGSSKKQVFQKNICFIDYNKVFDCVDHNKLWKILKKYGNTRPPYLLPEKSVCRLRSNS